MYMTSESVRFHQIIPKYKLSHSLLLQAYFRDFTFERLERPWRAFTGSWLPEVVARHMGINSSFVQGDHCYVLVRLSRFRDTVRLDNLPDDVRLVDAVAEEIEGIDVGNVSAVLQFIRKYGSHYITSYITGNSLYQVRWNFQNTINIIE